MAKKINFNTLVPYAQHVINQKILMAAIDAEKHNRRAEYFRNFESSITFTQEQKNAAVAPPLLTGGGSPITPIYPLFKPSKNWILFPWVILVSLKL